MPAITSSPDAGTDGISSSDRTGDRRLHAIVVEHHDFVWRSLRRLGVSPPETDDAAQQVFIVLARKLADVEVGKERSFLFGLVMRIAANTRRAHAKRREVPEEEAPAHVTLPTAEASLGRAQARAVLDAILAKMPEERRVVFVLAVLEELPLAEVASTLGIPVTTAEWRLRRAREELDAAIVRLHARKQGV
ncbi:RNA polymerase sigma factor [Labilithrix luteola]|uniref:RNA polymerase sigma factor n=1 Tax=Labilithrix luteola TaxID=1391654 RepID=UPI0014737F93|nr:sigma-70 family RNA polymerase sigma factor [Labilithrix luteola]